MLPAENRGRADKTDEQADKGPDHAGAFRIGEQRCDAIADKKQDQRDHVNGNRRQKDLKRICLQINMGSLWCVDRVFDPYLDGVFIHAAFTGAAISAAQSGPFHHHNSRRLLPLKSWTHLVSLVRFRSRGSRSELAIQRI